jgi:hypothetical protein
MPHNSKFQSAPATPTKVITTRGALGESTDF